MKHNQSDIGKGFFFAKDLQFESTKSPSSTNHAQIGSWLQLISSASRRCKKISPGGALYCRGRVLSSLVTLSMVAPDPRRHRRIRTSAAERLAGTQRPSRADASRLPPCRARAPQPPPDLPCQVVGVNRRHLLPSAHYH